MEARLETTLVANRWDLYQAKHYEKRLTPGNAYPELVKLFGHLIANSLPLKSYADPKSKEQREVALSTVTDRFYSWLSQWAGPRQVIILENQEIQEDAKTLLEPLEFVGDGDDEGRRGFYPTPTA